MVQVEATAQIYSLARKLPYAVGVAKRKKKEFFILDIKHLFFIMVRLMICTWC